MPLPQTKHVPPQRPAKNPTAIMFVGEAPGSDEVIKGQPFVGPSGRIFNSILRAANMERDEFHVTNVFDQKAPDNDVTEWMKDDEIVAYNFERLNKEIAEAQPSVIVPLGSTALWAFTEQKKISTFRGATVKATRLVPGAKLLPTYHPQAVQRDWRLLPIVTGDFMRAAKEAEIGPQFVYPKRTLLIEPTVDDVWEYTETCMGAEKLSVDIETGWGQVTCIAFAPTPYEAMCIPFMDMRKPNRSYWPSVDDEVSAWKAVKKVCEYPVPKIGQNFVYDLIWMREKYGIDMRNYQHDTRLKHKVLYPELPADLASMNATYTKIGAYKHWGGHWQKEKKDG